MKLSTNEMIRVSLLAALTAIGAFLSIPIGHIPITLQSIFVLLSGLLLGPKLAGISQLVYVLLGLSGLRVFAGFSGGLQSISKPSFGFLIGFIFAAFITGKIVDKQSSISLKRVFFASSIGTLTMYLFGIPYMYIILNKIMNKSISLSMVIKMGCLVFLPGDIFKVILSSLIGYKILRRIPI